ncbi:hypothetical protein HMSSN036_10150 [Paenibacillus macerans]|uniref:hypothetical protein n=1 Tax=Paenibacillus TaxID=44249 RepID=UPI00097A4533|nr:hypothetical protein [Paenibacillus macerans]MBS5909394.1 hypothetical protein [Paenibacillus macerans]MDU5946832.1 hypothetical protein [Paenibacillus macerans]MEC0137100.1 hypothetical protein [Paenibacillus macerans]MED4958902.1 hypothetical protein [Paenibacillus macerans]OMG46742.1 hypothetical protein BK140_25210 [Paenibacillus macerans]
MSKLDGNERWKSKMLLTEHQEQYESRNDPKKTSRPTTEELSMIRDYILLPYMLTMVQKSADDIERSPNLLKQLYLAAGQAVINKISKDMYDLRRELTKRNIKIISDEHADLVVYHRFLCRGYEDRFGMTRDVMRSEISVRLKKYIKEVVGRIANEK